MKVSLKIMQGGSERVVTSTRGTNLFHVLRDNGIYVDNSCGGNHTCGKCIVYIDSSDSFPMSPSEERLLKLKNAEPGMRLACFIDVLQDMRVIIPAKTLESQILVRGEAYIQNIDARVKRECAVMKKPDIYDQRDDSVRLQGSLTGGSRDISMAVLRKLPFLVSDNDKSVEAVTYKQEVVDIFSSKAPLPIFGIAVDIGTTTIAAYLLNLETGEQSDVFSALNPQKPYGADVITRIDYTVGEKNGLATLQHIITEELNRIIGSLCSRNKITRDSIYEVVVVGNNTMLHLLLGINCHNIARSPFNPVFTSEICLKAEKIGLHINEEGYLYTLPSVSSYVGADTVAAVLATGMHQDEKINLLIDIGTNGEIVLGNKDNMVCCSTAAGPAFEGGKITFGMGGVFGAIDHVNIEWENLYTTIGNIEPVGICGSGLVDTVAELLSCGIIDKKGRMRRIEKQAEHIGREKYPLAKLSERMVTHEGGTAFLLEEETRIMLTQGDIRELQLAKAAIYSGIEILIDSMGIQTKEIEKVYLAGGFGNYLNIDSAIEIGLIPRELRQKVIPVGNGAGTGAKMALMSELVREEGSRIKMKMKHIDLSVSKLFQQRFIKALNF